MNAETADFFRHALLRDLGAAAELHAATASMREACSRAGVPVFDGSSW